MIKRIFIILVSVISGINFLLADSEPASKMMLRDVILEVSSNHMKGLYNPDSYDEKWLPRIVQATNKEVANRVVKEKEAVVEEKPVVLKQMYCITNNVPVYKDFPSTDASADAPAGVPAGTPAVLAVPGDTNVKGYIDQLMKYDRVGLIETKGEWARIVRSPSVLNEVKDVSRGATQGWVSKNTLAEWKIEEFLKQKENVFKENKRIELYAESGDIQEVSVKTKKFDYIEPGETFRVLKGNGEGFFVVTGSGKTGWIANESIDTTRLVAKGFGYKEKSEYVLPKSEKYFSKIDKKEVPVKFQLMPEDILSISMLNGKYEKVLKFGYKDSPGRRDIIFSQNGKETNVNEVLGRRLILKSYSGDEMKSVDINGKTYHVLKEIILNFFGMVGVIEVYLPAAYIEEIKNWYKKNLPPETFLDWKGYEKLVEYLRDKNYKEIVKVTFYTRDVELRKIKEFELEGSFAFLPTTVYEGSFAFRNFFEYLNIHSIEERDEGLIIELGIANNGVLLDEVPFVYYNNGQILPIDVTGRESFNNLKYAMKMKKVEFVIGKEELNKAGVKAEEIKQFWDNYVEFKKSEERDGVLTRVNNPSVPMKKIREFEDNLFKSIVINGKVLWLRKDYEIVYQNSIYAKGKNVYLLHFYIKKAKGGGGGYIIMNSKREPISINYYQRLNSLDGFYNYNENILEIVLNLQEELINLEFLREVTYGY